MKCKSVYEAETAKTRDQRMKWWREARFGMFVHYGIHTMLGRNEWAMAVENYEIDEYEEIAETFCYESGNAREWAQLAKNAGMKYMVLTTRHHEGYSLWDSKVNPYNSVNIGPKIDIVEEFVAACREFGLGIGFYSSLMDWHHPDGGTCIYDREARIRFTDYIKELNRELLTQYGKIDILWYDVPRPMESIEGWNSLELNQMVRELQPDIIINNRSRLDEDFGTPEEHLTAMDKDWEACMTFNGISWGYLDAEQVIPYSYTSHQIIRMLNRVTLSGGNLLLNIGPTPEGHVPAEAIEPLTKVGDWLKINGEAVYGKKDKTSRMGLNGACSTTCEDNIIYLSVMIWPKDNYINLGGIMDGKLEKVTILADGTNIEFQQKKGRIKLINLPNEIPDKTLGITVIKLEFDDKPEFVRASRFPQLNEGRSYF